ncbi:hypothetical protein CEXT_679021 [Caerostris extrusa]|uniref:Uncharacterized protein n=1 Tax=Caerostris extrusa TaxID=172846 RepID=A0AAV4VWQ5_CAEEX|nr:hypothetical protein CEXT_679021 [Caerostris extrusa]
MASQMGSMAIKVKILKLLISSPPFYGRNITILINFVLVLKLKFFYSIVNFPEGRRQQMTAGHLSLPTSVIVPRALDEVSLANCVFQGKVSTKRKENTKETAFDQGPSALAPEAVKKVRDKIRKTRERSNGHRFCHRGKNALSKSIFWQLCLFFELSHRKFSSFYIVCVLGRS